MKSDTPRTDAAVLDEHDPVTAVAHTCRQLERELSAANTRIERMKIAGDRIAQLLSCEAGYSDSEEWANAMREDQLRMIEKADYDWMEASK